MWLSMLFVSYVTLAWYCGKMNSHHILLLRDYNLRKEQISITHFFWFVIGIRFKKPNKCKIDQLWAQEKNWYWKVKVLIIQIIPAYPLARLSRHRDLLKIKQQRKDNCCNVSKHTKIPKSHFICTTAWLILGEGNSHILKGRECWTYLLGCFIISWVVQPQKVHSRSYCGCFQGIEPKAIWQ